MHTYHRNMSEWTHDLKIKISRKLNDNFLG